MGYNVEDAKRFFGANRQITASNVKLLTGAAA